MGTPDFAEIAFFEFGQIISTRHKNILEFMNRANKGELFILHFLSKCNSKVLPSELSTALQVTTGRISALLNSLEKKGQILREIDKNNRRNILVTITEVGRVRVEEEFNNIKGIIIGIIYEMGESDSLELLRLIKQFFDLSHKYIPEYDRDE